MKPLSLLPTERTMQTSSIRSERIGTYPNGAPQYRHIAVFEYPDCIREFDGTKWTITRDKRKETT